MCGDLLFSGSGETKEDIGKCICYLGNEKAYVGGDVIVLRQMGQDSLFLSYVLNSDYIKYQKAVISKGEIIIHIYASNLRDLKIPLPPLQEQKEIAEFLNSECEKIQNYIDKKQKLITLLQEKKQALINEAVCGRVACHTADSHCHTERSEVSTMESGFFANAQNDKGNISYKPSGIEYLGLIPHHWEVTNLKNIVSIKSGGTPSRDNKDYWNGDIPWIRSEFCHNQHIFQCDVKEKITTLGLQKSSAKMCKKNTILIALVGATIGQVAFLNFKSAINQNIAAIYPNNAAILDNVFLFFVALTFKQRFEILGKYAIANLAFIGNLKIPLPPLQEQKEIAAFLDSKVAQIDSVIEKTKKQIELVKEYKNTLINEAVCGRIACSRDFSFATQTQNDKVPTCHTANSPCHTERSEVSTMESGFFANAQE